MSNKLTHEDADDFARLEDVIRRGLETFVEVGNALAEIKERKLYRAEFGSFEGYVQVRWGWSRRHANRQIAAAETAQLLSGSRAEVGPIGPEPTSEAVLRPITSLPPEQQKEVWAEAVEASGGKPKARDVAAAVDRVIPAAVTSRRKEKKAAKYESAEDIAAALFAKKEATASPPASGAERKAPEPIMDSTDSGALASIENPSKAGIDQPAPARHESAPTKSVETSRDLVPDTAPAVAAGHEQHAPEGAEPSSPVPESSGGASTSSTPAIEGGGGSVSRFSPVAEVVARLDEPPVFPPLEMRAAYGIVTEDQVTRARAWHRFLGTFLLQHEIAREQSAKANKQTEEAA